MLNIVLFGAPGAGKGTQSAHLIGRYGLIHLSTGDLLRGEIAAETELGMKAKELMDKGELVPDEVVIGMIDNKISSNPESKGFIFDGFPRTIPQAEALDQLLESKGESISVMLELGVPKEELVKRLLERGKTSGRSDDQDEATVNNRIDVYNEKTAPVAGFYKNQNKYVQLDGVGTIDEITDRLRKEIDALVEA